MVDGKGNGSYNADFCLFMENWMNKLAALQNGTISEEQFESWQNETLEYYSESYFSDATPDENVNDSEKCQKNKKKIADLSQEHVRSYLEEIGKSEILSHIQCTGYVPHSELPALYGGASTFLYTSFRESFGIPQLEAMACLTPLVVSDKSALPEIAGPGAVYADPYNPESIAEAILRLENDEEFRKQTVEYGRQRVKEFSWEKAAEEVLAIYESLK